jgi:hypothetical protein
MSAATSDAVWLHAPATRILHVVLRVNAMTFVFISLAVTVGGATVYAAWRNREFRKFLAGAFFVSTGVQFYLYLADVSVPLLGTDVVQTPALSAARCVPNFIFFLITLYFGFIKKPKPN